MSELPEVRMMFGIDRHLRALSEDLEDWMKAGHGGASGNACALEVATMVQDVRYAINKKLRRKLLNK